MYEIFEKLMQCRNVTPYQISKATGISTATLSDWKNGKTVPKVDKLIMIADYFDVSLDYLLKGKDKKLASVSAPSTLDSELWINIRHNAELMDALPKYFKLDKQKQRYVLELIEIFSK